MNCDYTIVSIKLSGFLQCSKSLIYHEVLMEYPCVQSPRKVKLSMIFNAELVLTFCVVLKIC